MADDSTTVGELRGVVTEFVEQREWRKFHDAKNLSMAIAIEAAELMEHFQWARSEELPDLLADQAVRSEIADEIADITCFLLALTNALNLDLSDAVAAKMKKNAAKYPANEFRGRYRKPPADRP